MGFTDRKLAAGLLFTTTAQATDGTGSQSSRRCFAVAAFTGGRFQESAMKTNLTCLVIVLFLSPLAALAEGPRARFDVPQTIAVRDVTTPQFAAVHPHDRLIEACVPISMMLDRGPASEVRELVHRLESTTAGAQAVDYSPKTTLATNVVGTTRIDREKLRDLQASVDLGGGYYGIASAQAHGEYANRVREDSTFEQLPALELLTASGTVDRGRGVYFKLKPSPRTTLEGAHNFTMVLRVPRAWRAGLLYVTSEAHGGERNTLISRGRFVVAIYQQADMAAQEAAQRYAIAETALRHTSSINRAALERRTFPTPLHKLGMTRDGALARDWQDGVIFRGTADSELLQRLPLDVRYAVEALLKVRQELVELHRLPTLAVAGG
jgi:hypothetical protein